MQKFLESIWAKLIRIVLPAAAVAMGAIPGSYLKEVPNFLEDGTLASVDAVRTTYFAFGGNGLMDWLPLICMVLSIGAVIAGIVCLFKETENMLVLLANLMCFAMVSQLLIIIFLAPTVLGWCIAGVLAIALALTAVQEMKLEDKNRKV